MEVNIRINNKVSLKHLLLRSSTGDRKYNSKIEDHWFYTHTHMHTHITYGSISPFDLNNCWQAMFHEYFHISVQPRLYD